MGSGIYGIGISGLNAAQAGMVTTGHNIANVNTPGYNRQQIVQTTNTPLGGGSGFFGQGTQVTTVNRAYSDFFYNNLLQAQSLSSKFDTQFQQLQQVSNMLGDPAAGLSPAMQGFFNGVQNMANNPSSVPARQAMLGASQTMVAQFQAFNQNLSNLQSGINSQVSTSVNLINTYAQQIAGFNNSIVSAQNSNGGQPPNDLLDQRDQVITLLNKEINASVSKQTDGSYNVTIGNGQPLVLGSQAQTMTATPSQSDPTRTTVGLVFGGITLPIQESSITGGNLSGYLSFRSQSLDPAQNLLGRIGITLAQTFNTQHQMGMDLNGNLGGAYFNVGSPQVLANINNAAGAGAATATVTIPSAKATTTNGVNVNLQSTALPPAVTPFSANNPASYNFSTANTVYDSIGQTHTAGTYFVATATPNQWLSYSTLDGVSSDSTQNAGTITSAVSAAVTSALAPAVPTAAQTQAITSAAVTAAGVAGATSASIAAAITAAATAAAPAGAGLTAAQATAITTLTTSSGVAPIGTPNPSVVTFSAAGALLSATNLGKSVTLSNGAMTPFNYALDLTGSTQLATPSVLTAQTQNGNMSARQLTGNDYTLQYNNGAWSLLNNTTNQSVTMSGAGTAASPFMADGMNLVVSAPAVAGQNASFLIRPTVNGARDLGLAITDPNLIAASSPLRTLAAANPDGSSKNTGTGLIGPATVSNVNDPNLQANVTITFNTPANTFNVTGTVSAPALTTNIPYVVGGNISYNGWNLKISGVPNPGDSFTIGKNTSGVSDNQNALLLANLQTQNTTGGNSTTFQGAYAQFVSQVGAQTKQAQVSSLAQAATVSQASQSQQTVSGVNLDEEAANLQRYQRAYQAAGKMMTIAGTLFDTILAIK